MTNTSNTAVTALDAALSLARAEGRAVRSIKDLLCDACGEAVALAPGGFCHACAACLAAHHDETAQAHAAAVVATLDTMPADAASMDDDGARWCVGDDEGELLARGIRC
jgi:hypothetical protein